MVSAFQFTSRRPGRYSCCYGCWNFLSFHVVCCWWCIQSRTERVFNSRTGRRWLQWCWSSCYSHPNWDHHIGHQDTECSGREGSTNPWTNICGSEAIWIPRGNCRGMALDVSIIQFNPVITDTWGPKRLSLLTGQCSRYVFKVGCQQRVFRGHQMWVSHHLRKFANYFVGSGGQLLSFLTCDHSLICNTDRASELSSLMKRKMYRVGTKKTDCNNEHVNWVFWYTDRQTV